MIPKARNNLPEGYNSIMVCEEIRTKNNIYQHFYVLKTNRNKRHRYGEFLVEGVRNLNQALIGDWKIKALLIREGKLSDWAQGLVHTAAMKNYRLREELMRDLSGKEDVSELMAVVEMRQELPEQVRLSENPFLVVFDRPSNKGNLGTLIRSCEAFGVDALLLTGHGVDLYDPEVITATMGSFFRLPIMRVAENETLFRYLNVLREQYPGMRVVGSTAHRQHPICEAMLQGPLVLMIGNETAGLCQTFKAYCDDLLTIPMNEGACATSFNVSCAASVIMYEVMRQRREKG